MHNNFKFQMFNSQKKLIFHKFYETLNFDFKFKMYPLKLLFFLNTLFQKKLRRRL